MSVSDTQAFWRAYRRHEGLEHDRYRLAWFLAEPATAESSISAIADGIKRAFSVPLHYFREGGEEPMPVAGDHFVVLDPQRRPRLIWRVTSVAVAPLSAVSEEFMWCWGAVADSREAFLRRIGNSFRADARRAGFDMHDDVETVFETFELVWPLQAARRARQLAPRLEQGLILIRRLEEARAAARDLAAVLARVETAVMTVGTDLRLQGDHLRHRFFSGRHARSLCSTGSVCARVPTGFADRDAGRRGSCLLAPTREEA